MNDVMHAEESAAVPLREIVPADEPLVIDEIEHGDDALGRVEVSRHDDGTFRAVAHPCTDLTSFAPKECSNEDEAAVWANEHVDAFDDFMSTEYGFDIQTHADIDVESLAHTATALMVSTASSDQVVDALHAACPNLRRYDTELADGTVTLKWAKHLAAKSRI